MPDPRSPLFLRRTQRVIVAPGTATLPAEYVATLLHTLAHLGFTVSPALFERLQTQNEAQLNALLDQWVPVLRAMVGADVPYAPMYPNFPAQVMQASEAELYLNAWLHYVCAAHGHRWLPHYEKTPRPPLADTFDLKLIDLGTPAELDRIAQQLIGAKTSISPDDKADLRWLLTHAADPHALLPAEIPFKENLAFTAGVLLHTPAADKLLTRYFKTATDILRLAVVLSEGDVSLAEPVKFRAFKRAERRLLLALLDRCRTPLEDMFRHPERWKRLGERLHPGEYAKRFPNAQAAFVAVRANRRPKTFNSRVEAAFEAKDFDAVLALLRSRPGELARRMDHLLRTHPNPGAVVAAFQEGAHRIATPLLLQVRAHFRARYRGMPPLRAIFPKGESARMKPLLFDLPDLAAGVAQAVESACESTLIERFAALPALGRVYVDPTLNNYLVPFSQRSASRALRTLVRGSRIALPGGSTVRFFLWWKEGVVNNTPTGEVDIDLSAVMYDADWRYKEHISYTNLKSEKYQAAHSGDITSAPEGACEFIDLDIASIVKHGGRYVIMSVLSYSGQPFNRLPECHAGWMMRSAPGSGEIFEPSTVVDKLDIVSSTRVSIPVVLDLVERHLIWIDLGLKAEPRYQINIEANERSMSQMGLAMTTLVKPTLLDLFALHATARGKRVDTPEAADVVLDVASGLPYAVETIVSHWL